MTKAVKAWCNLVAHLGNMPVRCDARFTSLPSVKFGSILSQNFYDFLDSGPVAGGNGDTEELLDLAEVTDGFHLATIHAQGESAVDRDDLH